jgi:hypothetical protein
MSGPVETNADGTAPSATVGKFMSPVLNKLSIGIFM